MAKANRYQAVILMPQYYLGPRLRRAAGSTPRGAFRGRAPLNHRL